MFFLKTFQTIRFSRLARRCKLLVAFHLQSFQISIYTYKYKVVISVCRFGILMFDPNSKTPGSICLNCCLGEPREIY